MSTPSFLQKKTSPSTPFMVDRGKVARRVILRPHLTEKATRLAEGGSYIFIVDRDATKSSVKRAVEDGYKVNVRHVRISRIPSSEKRRGGRILRKRPLLKKAIVTLRKGQKIELTS